MRMHKTALLTTLYLLVFLGFWMAWYGLVVHISDLFGISISQAVNGAYTMQIFSEVACVLVILGRISWAANQWLKPSLVRDLFTNRASALGLMISGVVAGSAYNRAGWLYAKLTGDIDSIFTNHAPVTQAVVTSYLCAGMVAIFLQDVKRPFAMSGWAWFGVAISLAHLSYLIGLFY